MTPACTASSAELSPKEWVTPTKQSRGRSSASAIASELNHCNSLGRIAEASSGGYGRPAASAGVPYNIGVRIFTDPTMFYRNLMAMDAEEMIETSLGGCAPLWLR